MMNDRWRAYFAREAINAARMSRDPSTQCGAVIFNEAKQILATGYNGVPRGVEDGEKVQEGCQQSEAYLRRTRRPGKYLWMEHAERNAIYQAARTGTPLKEAQMMVTHRPCADCMRGIIQSGIERLWLLEMPMGPGCDWSESQEVGATMAIEADVIIHEVGPEGETA